MSIKYWSSMSVFAYLLFLPGLRLAFPISITWFKILVIAIYEILMRSDTCVSSLFNQLFKLLIELKSFFETSHSSKQNTYESFFFNLSFIKLKLKLHSLPLKWRFWRQTKLLDTPNFENIKNLHFWLSSFIFYNFVFLYCSFIYNFQYLLIILSIANFYCF